MRNVLLPCLVCLCVVTGASAAPEQAHSADGFVDSIGINPSLAQDLSNYPIIRQRLLDIGIRHIRHSQSSDKSIAMMRDLAQHGIKTMLLEDSNYGVAPDATFFNRTPAYDGSPHAYLLHNFVKKVGAGTVIDSVEMTNEVDADYSQRQQFWHPEDYPNSHISNDPKSPFYWVKYITAATAASWKALKSDPATAMVKVIGPASGQTYAYNTVPNPIPAGSLAPYVDYGAFHPYPGGGNFDTYRFPYDTVGWYLGQSNFPSVNIDTDDRDSSGKTLFNLEFNSYQPPFGDKPMIATETGYTTRPLADYTTFNRDISEATQAKYIPRLVCEYFNHGVVRTFLFNFVDGGEGAYGLMHHDYTPKPAYVALKNLISLLQDPGAAFTPKSLDYALAVQPVLNWKDPNTGIVSNYDRTQYVHHLLLQKRSGDFYLLLWHETSADQINDQDAQGRLHPGHAVTPPALPAVLALPAFIRHARLFMPNEGVAGTPLSVNHGQVQFTVPDHVITLKLTRS